MSLLMWAAIVLEAVIFLYVSAYVFVYVVPWETMRAKREARAKLREELPTLLERARAALRAAEAPTPVPCGASLQETSRRMTEDATRLAKLCVALIESISRDYVNWPIEALKVQADAASTVESIEKLCAMRDTMLPALSRRMVAAAQEMLTHSESLRGAIWAHVRTFAESGVQVTYELAVLDTLAAAIVAERSHAETDPEAVLAMGEGWRVRLQHVATSAHIRAALHAQVGKARSAFEQRVPRIRLLAQAAGKHIDMLVRGATNPDTKQRLRSLLVVEQSIDHAEYELLTAEQTLAAAGSDVDPEGVTAKLLRSAVHSAQLAEALVVRIEDDLAVVVAAVAAVAAAGPQDVN